MTIVLCVCCVFQRDERILALGLGRTSIRICRLPPPTTIYDKLALSEEVSLDTPGRTFLGQLFLQNLITDDCIEVHYNVHREVSKEVLFSASKFSFSLGDLDKYDPVVYLAKSDKKVI